LFSLAAGAVHFYDVSIQESVGSTTLSVTVN
jgi:hypothetical protein